MLMIGEIYLDIYQSDAYFSCISLMFVPVTLQLIKWYIILSSTLYYIFLPFLRVETHIEKKDEILGYMR